MFELTNVFRQDEPELIEVLDSVRVGKFEGKHEAFINARVLPRPTDEEVLTIATKNDIVDAVNKSRLDALPGEEVKFYGVDSSILEGKKFLDKENPYPVPIELKLKVGAQVMFTKNDDQNGEGLQRRWVNGTLGIIETFSEDKSSVFVRIDDGVPIEVKRSTWSRYEYQVDEVEDRATGRKVLKLVKRAVAEYIQTPLTPAWAVTINKSQGKTYERVHIDLGTGAWADGQAYVALSRVRKYAGMTLEKPVTQGDIRTSKDAKAFIEECQEFHNARKPLQS
jgi:ATP-dependent exoDNAse (exonuclease V) alpha subunit